jgi:PAS domain S-box-containing protein
VRNDLLIHDLLLSPDEAAEVLRAIRAGDVDAVVVNGNGKDEVFTFRNPDHAYRALVEAMGEGAALVSREGVICYHNARFAELAVGREAALRGLTLRGLVAPHAAAAVDKLLQRAETGTANVESELPRPDGTAVPVLLTASKTALAEIPVFCLVATDLTAQHEQENLYRHALIGISVAGHELRGPLQALALRLQVMLALHRGEAAPPSVANNLEHLEVMERQVQALGKLVESLLDLARIGSDQLALSLEDLDLAEIARAAVEASEDLARSKSPLTLEIHPARGRWDRLRLGQVCTNLVSNAGKYGLGRPIRIAVESDDRVARLIVEDHGVGLTRDEIDRLFRPFGRIATVKTAKGLGLGLYITAQIVHAHGGEIRVHGEPGVGSTFVVELPLVSHARAVEP